MLKTILKPLLALILIFAIAACAPTGVGIIDPDVVETSIAQTLTALPRTPDPEIPVTGDESPTPTLTVAAATETSSPTSTLTPLPLPTQSATPTALVLVTSTATLAPGVVQVSVSVPTNCRVGPGVEYARVGALLVGQVAEVVGRHAARNYWVIRNPARTGTTCWLWGQYATVVGDPNSLPVLTPPPPPPTRTPAPAFDIAYEGLESCSGTGWWVDLGLENLGDLAFRSVTLTIEDRDANVSHTQRSDGFIDRTGCNQTESDDALLPNASRTVSSPVLTANPTGHRLRVTVTVCSNTGQSGTCMTQTVNINP